VKIKAFIWRILAILVLLLASFGSAPVHADNFTRTEAILQEMTPREKIGQLFLVTFDGMSMEEDSPIYTLISEYHIGGVVLLAENNNFSSEDTLSQTQALITSLQQLEWETSQEAMFMDDVGTLTRPAYVPLFVGIPQIGNGSPGDQILHELTVMPSQMALGATWDLELAQETGQILGRDLASLGFNLYVGPNLDVLEQTSGDAAKYLGVNTYGGDPFWVGEMGKAFINGLHSGSEGGMLVVARNFPGTGNSDRPPDEEVATVRKSLEQLKQIELAPYFSVTHSELEATEQVDALMVSHIRYQGFQGNIRATTKPISFDANALQQIMDLSPLTSWRSDGGLVISGDLGSSAVRRFFDTTNEIFDGKQIVRNAFLAGNDILFMDNLITTGDQDSYTTLLSILDFFVQKYQEDSAFAQRVDSSVRRILNSKLGLYEEFEIENVLQGLDTQPALEDSQNVTFDIAQDAVTLISPSIQELDALLPVPPLWYEEIVIFSDVRRDYQCERCPALSVLDVGSFADSMVSLYGPQASGQIRPYNLASFTFNQLVNAMDQVDDDTNEALFSALSGADWVVFNMLDVTEKVPSSNALHRILEERPDLLSGKRVIVFAMDSPVYLDATTISILTAYYALYSKGPAFVDVAARVLMQEITPSGALPISLSAVGYDLIAMTAPDPNQVITLALVVSESVSPEEEEVETPEVTQTPEPSPTPSFDIGDTLTIRTGRIQDHNGNIVPNGTVVRFTFRILGEPNITQQFEAVTNGGVAEYDYRIESGGRMEITAISEPAAQSETLNIEINPNGEAAVFVVSPTPEVTATPTETPTEIPTESAEDNEDSVTHHSDFPTLGEWALGVMVMGLGGVLTYFVGRLWWGSTRWGLRSSLCSVIGSLLSYSYLHFGLSGTRHWMQQSGTAFVVEIVVVGLLLGWICALVWWMRTEGRYPRRN